MDHQSGFFKGPGNVDIFHQCWKPSQEASAVILVIHGMGEHSSRYMNVVNHFVPKGYAVYAFDHIGHGRSGGTRKFVRTFDDFLHPLNRYLGMIKSMEPERPIFILGHSMGGAITLSYLLNHPDAGTGVILTGPAIKPRDDIPLFTYVIGRILAQILPRTRIVDVDINGISRDPAVIEASLNDPLSCKKGLTARLASELLDAMDDNLARAGEIHLPTLILQGGDDRLVDPEGAQMLYDRLGTEDKTLKVYDALFHEVINEPEHQEVLQDMETWLARRMI